MHLGVQRRVISYLHCRNRFTRPLAVERLESRDLLAAFDLLVFSKTAEFRHSSIDDGIAAIQSLGAAHDFTVTATENSNLFTAANLASFEAVVFLNTTGDILNDTQQAAFEQYIQGGGGWVGVHSAADTEYGWAWYGGLVGRLFSKPSCDSAGDCRGGRPSAFIDCPSARALGPHRRVVQLSNESTRRCPRLGDTR